MDVVDLSKVRKALSKLPKHIVTKLRAWATDVETFGLFKVRQVPGYHDEPLLGTRKGERSIRLSKSYRAIYTVSKDGLVNIVEVQEVNKHDY